jgi:putative peptidoglycan lipid II flippase
VGLALATSAGAWLNLARLIWAAHRVMLEQPTVSANRVMLLVAIGLVLGLAFYAGQRFAVPYVGLSHLREEILLLILLAGGTILYSALIVALIGRAWLKSLLRDAATARLPKSADEPTA